MTLHRRSIAPVMHETERRAQAQGKKTTPHHTAPALRCGVLQHKYDAMGLAHYSPIKAWSREIRRRSLSRPVRIFSSLPDSPCDLFLIGS